MAATKPGAAKRSTTTAKKQAPSVTRAKSNPKTASMTTGTMGDKEVMTDMLSSQKFLASAYNNYAGECQDDALRNDMLNILKEEHAIQNELFVEMSSRGWYKTKPAPVREITTALNKYSAQQ